MSDSHRKIFKISTIAYCYVILSLFKKIIYSSKFGALVCIILSICVRVLELLAFLVPLKIVLIAASGQIPAFASHSLNNLSLNLVISFLVFTVVFAFFISALLSKLLEKKIESNVVKIYNLNRKSSPSIDFDGALKSEYTRIISAIGAVVFAGMLLSSVSLLNFQIGMILIALNNANLALE